MTALLDGAPLPHPAHRLPLLGDVVGASPRTPVQDVTRLAARLGPVFERTIFGTTFPLASGASYVADLMDETRFAKHLTPALTGVRDIAGDGLFTAYNDEPNWAAAHALLQPAFSQSAMRGYHATMLDVIDELCQGWSTRHEVDVAADMTKVTLETIGRTGFSKSFDSFASSRTDPFVTAMVDALSYSQLASIRIPVVTDLLRRRRTARYAQNRAYLNSVVDRVIDDRLRTGGGPHDLLDLMLFGDDGGASALDRTNVRNQVITFLIAGHETTSGALSFALYYLTRHPDIAARVRAEVDEVWGDETRPAFEQVAKLRYTRRVLDEALRLWPTAPGFARAATTDTVIGGNCQMRRGDWFIVLLPALHRDPEVWGSDPDAFDPDRFLPANVKARPAHAYKPFGTGERACIGRQFALHEAVLVLGQLLRRFDLEADPAYDLRVTERLTLMPSGFTVRPHLRATEPASAAAR